MKIPTRSRGMNTERLLQQSLVLISNYVAYYKILVNVYCKGFGHFPLVLLSGMFFCDCVDFGSEGVPSLARKLGRSVKRLHRRTPSVNPFVLFLVIFMLSVLGIVTFGNL